MMKRSAAMALALALLSSGQAVRAAIEVRDDAGETLILKAPARRIVSLAPHITENLFSAGAGSRIVGTVEYSDWPEAARKIPRVGGSAHLDLEAILALKPDLVLAWKSGGSSASLAKLRSLGIPLYLSEPDHIEDVGSEIGRLGRLAGTEDRARAAASEFQTRHRRLLARYGSLPKVRAFYQIWNQPVMTVNGEHLISDMIRLCGGENVFAGLRQVAPVVTEEAVLAANPEAIVASGMGEARPDWLDAWKRWKQITATSRDNLFFIPPELVQRHTARILDGAERLCTALETARSRRARETARP